MTDTLTLDRLNTLMNKAGIEDHEIIDGVQLTRLGYQRLASKFGVTTTEMNAMINELISKLRKDQSLMAESYGRVLEGEERFSYEKDWLGNVTVRDSHSADETFLRGTQAAAMLNALKAGGDEQEILAHYMSSPVTESADDEEGDSYEPEIDTDRGTFNFPWKFENEHGTGTVEYGGKGIIKLISVRDASGEEMDYGDPMGAALKQQAVAFIGEV